MARCFSNLTELCIHLVEFRHSQQVLDLLSCFQMLQKISIGATFATEDQASSSIPPPNLRHLRVLRLRVGMHGSGAFRDIISWFIPTNGLPAIQTLSIAALDASLFLVCRISPSRARLNVEAPRYLVQEYCHSCRGKYPHRPDTQPRAAKHYRSIVWTASPGLSLRESQLMSSLWTSSSSLWRHLIAWNGPY
ncbi:hypothetical protein B0H14DRAFT_27344 [Mycena olivaceomarginata]|nr:hypothetical protein B0H14DRAFT_27344 [Mycena olivaceomarginata]